MQQDFGNPEEQKGEFNLHLTQMNDDQADAAIDDFVNFDENQSNNFMQDEQSADPQSSLQSTSQNFFDSNMHGAVSAFFSGTHSRTRQSMSGAGDSR